VRVVQEYHFLGESSLNGSAHQPYSPLPLRGTAEVTPRDPLPRGIIRHQPWAQRNGPKERNASSFYRMEGYTGIFSGIP